MIWKGTLPKSKWLTLHRKRHAVKFKLGGGYVYALCGVIGRPSMLALADGRCAECERQSSRAERDGNRDLMAA